MAKGVNKIEYDKKVKELARKEYTGSWKETWAKFVCPIYPMSYVTFSRIMNNWKPKKK